MSKLESAAGFFASLFGLIAGGCATAYVVPAKAPDLLPAAASPAAPPAKIAAAAPAEARPRCEVMFRAEHLAGDSTIVSAPVCLKYQGGPVNFPDPIFLHGHEGHLGTQFNGMCLDVGKDEPAFSGDLPGPSPAPPPGGKSPDDKTTQKPCAWTHLFRDGYPFTFSIETTDHLPLSRFFHIIRVFRNGRLVFAWKGDSTIAKLAIPGSALLARLMPFGAPLDLRIIPTGVPIDEGRTMTSVDAAVDPLRRNLDTVLRVAREDLVTNDPDLPPELACLVWQVGAIRSIALTLAGGAAITPDPPPHCAPVAGPADEARAKLRSAIARAAATADSAVDAELEAVRRQSGALVEATARQAKDALIKRVKTAPGLGVKTQEMLRHIDDLTASSAQTFDRLDLIARQLQVDARRFIEDRDRQAAQLAAATAALEKQGSAFDPFTENPALVEGEIALRMEYGDRFQFFAFAPWHGVPIRLTQNPGASFGIENAIPVMDVVGFRYQWGSGRSTSLRAGVGILYFKDEATEKDAVTDKENTKSVFNFAGQLNFSWTGIILGLGYVLNHRDYGSGWNNDRLRLIVGADLLKVFGNRSAEAF